MVAVTTSARRPRPRRGRLTLANSRGIAGHGPRRRAPRRRSPRPAVRAGWAWTYVIVAELIGASVRHRPHDHRQPGAAHTGQIIFGITAIGLIGPVRLRVQGTRSSSRALVLSAAGALRDERRTAPARPPALPRRHHGSSSPSRGGGRLGVRRRAHPSALDAGLRFRSPTTTSSRSSGPRAAASRRCCASSRASTGRARAACCSTAALKRGPGR